MVDDALLRHGALTPWRGSLAPGVRAAVATGRLVPVLRGIYLPSARRDDPWARAAALSAVLPPGAAVCGRTAAWLWGVDPRGPSEPDGPIPLECAVPPGTEPPSRPGVRARIATLAGDVVDLCDVRVTSPERTALDIARFAPPPVAIACLDRLVALRSLDLGTLGLRLESFRGGRGVVQARRLLQVCDPGAESAGESWTRLRLADAGFPRPETQIWVCDAAGGARYRLDMGWRARRVGIEYDGEEYHAAAEQRRHDERRRAWLASVAGWHVVGVGKGEVLGRSTAFERGVGELLGLEPGLRRRAW